MNAGKMLHFRFIFRQIRSSGKQAFIFVLCVALSLLTLVSLGGFSSSVRSSMLKDARQLHAADIIVHSHYPLSSGLQKAIKKYEAQGLTAGALVHEFYSMASNPIRGKSLLSHLKVVEEGYPFYGEVELASGRKFSKVLTKGSIIVDQSILDRINAGLGDHIQIGSAELVIADTVIAEPDRPVSFFSFGPRVFIGAADLQRVDLIRKGSRIHYNYLLKVYDPALVDRLAGELSDVAVGHQERVNTFENAESGVKRFFENFLFFLNLIGIFTLLLAGIGIQTALFALLRESEYTIGVMKALGAANHFISYHFIAMIMLLGTGGTFLGLALSFLLQLYLPTLFAGILPASVNLTISWGTVFEGLLLGTIVVGLFSFMPLRRVRNLTPAAIFRKESGVSRGGLEYYATIGAIICFFTGLTVWQLEDVTTGIYFVLGLFVLLGLTAFVTQVLLLIMKKNPPRTLALRQAFKGLFRPKNATRAIIITLSASLAVIFSIYLIEQNLQATFIQSYPPDLPNAYFLDIQTSQRQDFAAILATEMQYYPIVRARLAAINSRPIDRDVEKQRKRDNLSREFNLTYRNILLDDEQLLEGDSLFGNQTGQLQQQGEVPVSVLDTVAEIGDIRMGDLLVFKVQSIPVKARVTSMRTRTQSQVRPYFYFVFQEATLKEAPQTIFSAAKIDNAKLTEVQNRLAEELPNISVIDIAQTIEVLARIMHKLSAIVQFFTSFSIIAGLLIIISSIFATRLARIREAVYYKILGARSSFILQVFTLENLVIALMCSIMAGLIAQAGSWIICNRVFAISYNPRPGSTATMICITVLLVITVGIGASLSILQQKPVFFLRDQE
jgi:putative ABC transport system permease protein